MPENKALPTVLEFNCPACGSPDRLGQRLAQKVKDRGLMRPELGYYAWQVEGVVRDPTKELVVPIGSKLPAFRIFVDACLQCGCLYAAKVEIGEVVKGLMPTIKGPPPGSLFSPS